MDWQPYLVGGGTRPDAISGLDDPFESMLGQLFAAAPPDIQGSMRVTSAYRSPEVQAQLYEAAVAKYGSPEAARKWVAPPGRSNHGHGTAVDLKYLSPEAQAWAHANAAQYGLHFPMSWEPWHIEPMGGQRPAGEPPVQQAAQPGQQPSQQPPVNPLAPQQPQMPQFQRSRLNPADFAAMPNMLMPLDLSAYRVGNV